MQLTSIWFLSELGTFYSSKKNPAIPVANGNKGESIMGWKTVSTIYSENNCDGSMSKTQVI